MVIDCRGNFIVIVIVIIIIIKSSIITMKAHQSDKCVSNGSNSTLQALRSECLWHILRPLEIQTIWQGE
jgi:hypothetical protein